jgi:hypothetical protein
MINHSKLFLDKIKFTTTKLPRSQFGVSSQPVLSQAEKQVYERSVRKTERR